MPIGFDSENGEKNQTVRKQREYWKINTLSFIWKALPLIISC